MSRASLLLCENPQNGSQTKVTLAMGFFAMVMLALSGCGLTINNPAFVVAHQPPPPATAALSTQIHGHVGGAEWSVSASSIQLYSAGTQGTASNASPLLGESRRNRYEREFRHHRRVHVPIVDGPALPGRDGWQPRSRFRHKQQGTFSHDHAGYLRPALVNGHLSGK